MHEFLSCMYCKSNNAYLEQIVKLCHQRCTIRKAQTWAHADTFVVG